MGVHYLRHAKHGTKVAIEEAEVEQDKKRGWVEFDPNAKAPQQPESKPAKAQEAARTI